MSLPAAQTHLKPREQVLVTAFASGFSGTKVCEAELEKEIVVGQLTRKVISGRSPKMDVFYGRFGVVYVERYFSTFKEQKMTLSLLLRISFS